MPTKAKEKKDREQEVEESAQSNYELGQVVVYESMWKRHSRDAGTLFSNNQDVLAKYVRRLANELKEEAERMRKEYMEKWHPETQK